MWVTGAPAQEHHGRATVPGGGWVTRLAGAGGGRGWTAPGRPV